ncbi:MAG: potassium/proton antiporter [Sporichthyaceae bacterium]
MTYAAGGTALDDLNLAMFVGSLVLIVALVAVRLAASTSLPTLLLYLGLGVLLGEDVVGIQFDDHELTRVLGYAALVIILAEGGLTTSWRHVKPAMLPAAVLATVGVGISTAVTGVAAHFLLDLSWRNAFLLGVIISSTDAAAVFSVLRLVPLRHRVAGILEAESGFNDAPVVILVVVLSTSDHLTAGHLGHELLLMGVELVGGAAVGVAVGFAGAAAVRRIAFPNSGLYPITVLALAACAYGGASLLHTSGFLAVYLAALILGNSGLPHGPATRGFVEGLAWLSQIGLFVLLGLLVTPSEMGDQILPAIGVGFALLLLGRPLSVALTTSWFRVPWREQAFLSWAGLRGAVPIVFATIPVVEQVPGSEDLFEIVFVLAVFYTLVQGTTLPWMAKKLQVTEVDEIRGLDLEVAPLERMHADVLTMRIPEGSRLHGVEVFELRLPPGASVSLIVRDETTFVPVPTTRLAVGDDLLVVCPTALRRQTEERLRAVGEHGRLAGWLGQSRTRRRSA